MRSNAAAAGTSSAWNAPGVHRSVTSCINKTTEAENSVINPLVIGSSRQIDLKLRTGGVPGGGVTSSGAGSAVQPPVFAGKVPKKLPLRANPRGDAQLKYIVCRGGLLMHAGLTPRLGCLEWR